MEIGYSEMRCREIIENHLRPLLNKEEYLMAIKKWIEIVRNNAHKNFNVDDKLGKGGVTLQINK